MNIDEWLAVALSIIWVVLVNVFEAVVFRKKERKPKKPARVMFVILDIIVVALMVIATLFNFSWNSNAFRTNIDWSIDSGNAVLTREQALEELRDRGSGLGLFRKI